MLRKKTLPGFLSLLKVMRKMTERQTLVKCVVEMFGLALEESGLREVEIELPAGSDLSDLIASLRVRVPSLVGGVIRRDENRLVDRCAFNIDGRFYFEDTGYKLEHDCSIRLLTLATGG